MPILHIQHRVPDFDAWKQAFDNDPMDRRGSGVLRYDVYRSVDNPNFVLIDLELQTIAEAEAMLERFRNLWTGPGAAVMRSPQAWILEKVESETLG